MVNNKKKTVEELAKEMDTACALSSEISEEELIEYDAEYGYDYHEEEVTIHSQNNVQKEQKP